MDELAFRSSQKIENIQLQAQLVATKTKDVLLLYSQQTKLVILRLLHSPSAEQFRTSIGELYDKVLTSAKEFKGLIIYHVNPQRIYHSIVRIFGKTWTKRDIYFGCAGLFVGILIGLSIGITLKKKEPVLRYMQAVQCNHYSGCESVTVVEDAIAPFECGEYEVLVNVKAASIQFIDIQICNGYGRTYRKILQKASKQSESDLPIILGRDCAGIIADIGCKVTRLDVGDEVWLSVPVWSQGTLCQTVLVAENRVSRKPTNIGFEGASSLPYAGSLAFSALGEAGIDSPKAHNKRILVIGGCTPTGCILIQLLKYWNATVTTTCYKKAVPVVKALGASDIIVLTDPTVNNKSFLEKKKEDVQVECNILLKELELKGDIYDVIINASNDCADLDLRKFCMEDGIVISALPPPLSSDSYGFISDFLLSLFIRIKYKIKTMVGLPINDYDETHLCYVMLDRLAQFVENGYLQSVVDKVVVPEDIEIALNHIQHPLSIGSTVVTFR